MEQNTQRPSLGLHTDNSPIDQPKDTYRFALNATTESERGDSKFIGNAESNEACAELPEGFIPLGKEYMSNGQTAIFLTNPKEDLPDIIGIVDDQCHYTTHVRGNLGFSIANQIDATYRLRRGCERTIYFTDNLNKPRYYNFDKPEDFIDPNTGEVVSDRFSLFKTYNSIPNINKIEIEETGQLASGSYNFSIQYLDDDLNPTEWITTTDTIIIYHDNPTSKKYGEIRGTTNESTFHQDFGVTNKAIRLSINNLDTNFNFYRVAIIEATSGGGEVSRVLYSSEISTSVATYLYSGSNATTLGTEEEVQQFSNIIERAEHIEQIENRLILGNTQGKQLSFCSLQKYASLIKANLIKKEIVLNNVEIDSNQKRAQLHTEKVGYMPGEIYSFGIVYLFEDGTTSPVFHIPGRNEGFLSEMSTDNIVSDSAYLDNNSCSNDSYWGVDSQGDPLVAQPIRHHRFPLRSEVNEPLFTKVGTTEFSTLTTQSINIVTSGRVVNYEEDVINYRVQYEVDGVLESYIFSSIIVSNYDSNVGDINTIASFILGSIENITIEEENPIDGTYSPAGSHSGLSYTFNITDTQSTSGEDSGLYTSNIFGIEFEDIQIPDINDTNGESIVGYYIVRNERTEDNKTILDTGVLAPMLVDTDSGNGFIAHGQLAPNSPDIQPDVFALIHPEHKFNNREYRNTTKLIREGDFVLQNKTLADVTLDDVQPGTSYDSDAHKRRDRDTDGFSLHAVNRNHTTTYLPNSNELSADDSFKEIFYLDSLFAKNVEDINGEIKDVYNLSSDNRTGVVQFNEEVTLPNRLPYVIMKRDLTAPYANFSVLPYFREFTNPVYFNGKTSSSQVFNGDSYIASMNYMSSLFYDIRLRKRKSKSGVLNAIIGVVAIVVGVVVSALTFGAAAPLGAALIGFGVAQIATGLKKEQLAKVYGDLYEQGLKNTVQDEDTESFFRANPSDDTIQWFHDSITDIWFETSINVNLRMGSTAGITDFQSSPTGYNQEQTIQYCIDKLTTPDAENDDGKNYLGYAKSEIYEVNKDYHRRDRQKVYFALGIEYDCCSDCLEDFPHRVHFSEQSFQEELSDNYRTFLVNNYRDIEGETGQITNIFRMQNNLYVHTEEALWHLPQNIQERITGDIVSFIGTGSFFNIPPRFIVDGDNGNSAGTLHKWGSLKTPHGVFFVSERQGVVYQFNGNSLVPISSNGLFNWFKNNLKVQADIDYYNTTGKTYAYNNNPSNPYGSGFLSTYDSRKERFILTKKDFVVIDPRVGEDYELCIENGDLTLFPNITQTISERALDGWQYEGVSDCKLQFSKESVEQRLVQTFETIETPNDTIILAAYDKSGSFNGQGEMLQEVVTDWYKDFTAGNDLWTGSLHHYTAPLEDDSERWLRQLTFINEDSNYPNLTKENVLLIVFSSENTPRYHSKTLSETLTFEGADTSSDLNSFKSVHDTLSSFIGISYPIVFEAQGDLANVVNIQQQLALMKGVPYTDLELSELLKNPSISDENWETILTSLRGVNPYPKDGLEQYGWSIVTNRDYTGGTDLILAPEEFGDSVNTILEGLVEVNEVLVERDFPITIVEEVEGVIINDLEVLNNSWTLSYNLNSSPNHWQAWHSYIPSFYYNTPNTFHSWVPNSDYLWRHNLQYNYQTYYGKRYPFIFEYVSLKDPLSTKIWEHLALITEAKKFNTDFNESVDERFITFNKGLFYNSRQSSGVLNLLIKDVNKSGEDYLLNQVQGLEGDSIIIDRNERDWTVNDLRDNRVDYTTPLFTSKLQDLQEDYYIDKVVNEATIDYNKDWTQLESFRDKYLVVRLYFDTFEDVKLLMNFSSEVTQPSIR